MKKLTMFVACYTNDDGTPDFFIFVAPENCDRVKEFNYAYKKEQGQKYDGEMYPEQIYNITTAYDYRAKTGGNYNIKLFKD
jgi:hypothetical protein